VKFALNRDSRVVLEDGDGRSHAVPLVDALKSMGSSHGVDALKLLKDHKYDISDNGGKPMIATISATGERRYYFKAGQAGESGRKLVTLLGTRALCSTSLTWMLRWDVSKRSLVPSGVCLITNRSGSFAGGDAVPLLGAMLSD
jgi:hypothetical protein